MNKKKDNVRAATERVLQLESELEAEGTATTGDDPMIAMRAALHDWVDTVVAVVASPGVGRVTLIHDDGSESRIASPDLPFRLSRPARFDDQG
ncbi:hypothetical protein MOK15_18175 [Sphingobium sp. BYY-5]|jgi:hypothetical protein|uniref:hypothetical protein n=1 Tax=Sphingobium sp. BYY-5 TaxID=2926400 RepID=UPI001FA76211|nr:hypothetical protein [Sphingobium sp. BYY-5]MCI4592017.1 hypothetical protein [Sphingobium sp. BYY-5]